MHHCTLFEQALQRLTFTAADMLRSDKAGNDLFHLALAGEAGLARHAFAAAKCCGARPLGLCGPKTWERATLFGSAFSGSFGK